MDASRCLAHLLSGEPLERKLAPEKIQELARRAIRYYEDDLVLVDYDAAIIVDQGDVSTLVDLFEIASAQLLELRFYEGMLGSSLEKLLKDVRMAQTAVWLFRSPFRRIAHRAARRAQRSPRTCHHAQRGYLFRTSLSRSGVTLSPHRGRRLRQREDRDHQPRFGSAWPRDSDEARPPIGGARHRAHCF
jgi:hypothetical protein